MYGVHYTYSKDTLFFVMDLQVPPENVAEALTKLREFVVHHLLPRLTDLEMEVNLLRKFTWPACAMAYEKSSQMDNIQAKKSSLMNVHPDDIKELLKTKDYLTQLKNPINPFTHGRSLEEYDQIVRDS